MYTKIEEKQRIHQNDASVLYPNSYIVMRFEDMESQIGEMLYACDTEDEALTQIFELDDRTLCSYIEGQTLRRSMGGVVVGG
ncbi:MAG: hypothetical protein LBI54_05430 [Lachnospiraceae bacterium]|nr:hypothetical protein [Lachnospiraceae bacterium]